MHDTDDMYSPLITIVLSLIINDNYYQQSRGEDAEAWAGNPFGSRAEFRASVHLPDLICVHTGVSKS